jgi:hypothetical protein
VSWSLEPGARSLDASKTVVIPTTWELQLQSKCCVIKQMAWLVVLCLLLFGGSDARLENEGELWPAAWRRDQLLVMQEAVRRCTFVRLSGPVIVSRDANSLG